MNLQEQFDSFHTEPINLFLHLLTVFLGFTCFFSLVNSAIVSLALVAAAAIFARYYFATRKIDRTKNTGYTLMYLLSMVVASQYLRSFIIDHLDGNAVYKYSNTQISNLNLYLILGLVSSYFLQDAAHLFCGEATLESTYKYHPWDTYLIDMSLHTVLLPFLLINAICNNGRMIASLFSWFLAQSTIVYAKTDPVKQKANVEKIASWIRARCQLDEKATTRHWWFTDREVDDDLHDALKAISDDSDLLKAYQQVFNPRYYTVLPIWDMNEIYVSTLSLTGTNSDTVFYTQHIDGPWGFFLGGFAYRCMFGLNENVELTTYFPMKPFQHTITTYEALGFDFNREIHYIAKNEVKNKEVRMNLKLHYIAVPRILSFLGPILAWLTMFYDRRARSFFLYTLNPSTRLQVWSFEFIMFSTHLTRWFEQLIGFNNAIYIVFAMLVSYFGFGSAVGWYAMTSFVHYIHYILTWSARENITYYSFLRNVVLYKSIMYINLFLMVYSYFSGSLPFFNVSRYATPVSAHVNLPAFTAAVGSSSFVLNIINATVAAASNAPLAGASSSALAFQEYLLANQALLILGLPLLIVGYTLSISATAALGTIGTYFGIELGLCEYRSVSSFPYNITSHPMIIGQILALTGIYLVFSECVPLEWIAAHVVLYVTHATQEHITSNF